MNQSNYASWIPYLKDPLVLVGFAMMLVATIATTLLKKEIFTLSKAASERVINNIVLCLFLLGGVSIVLSFGLALRKANESAEKKIKQETQGEQSPTIVGPDVKIKYGDPHKDEPLTPKSSTDDTKKNTASPSGTSRNIEQKTSGRQSPAVVSDEEVKIKYNNK